jgi:hypothetical protein
MISAVQFYDVVVFLHIMLVILAIGPTYAYGVFLAVAERSDPRAIPTVARGILAWDKAANFLLLGILLAGLYLVADGPWEFSDFYISWGFVAILVFGGASGAFFVPKTKELIEVAERDVAASGTGEVRLSADFQALSGALAKVGTAVGLFGVLTVYVMTAKPFL